MPGQPRRRHFRPGSRRRLGVAANWRRAWQNRSDKNAEARQYLAELEAEQEQVATLARRHHDLLTSTSWRITRPIRGLGRLIRGQRPWAAAASVARPQELDNADGVAVWPAEGGDLRLEDAHGPSTEVPPGPEMRQPERGSGRADSVASADAIPESADGMAQKSVEERGRVAGHLRAHFQPGRIRPGARDTHRCNRRFHHVNQAMRGIAPRLHGPASRGGVRAALRKPATHGRRLENCRPHPSDARHLPSGPRDRPRKRGQRAFRSFT